MPQDDYRIACVGTACDFQADSTTEGEAPSECPQCHNGLGARLEKQILVRMSGRNMLDPLATTAQRQAWKKRNKSVCYDAVNPCDDGAEAYWIPVA